MRQLVPGHDLRETDGEENVPGPDEYIFLESDKHDVPERMIKHEERVHYCADCAYTQYESRCTANANVINTHKKRGSAPIAGDQMHQDCF